MKNEKRERVNPESKEFKEHLFATYGIGLKDYYEMTDYARKRIREYYQAFGTSEEDIQRVQK